MVARPDDAFVLGGTWRVPVLAGLQDKNFITDLRQDGTFNESAFSREYESEWSGTFEESFFTVEQIDKHRELVYAEREATKNIRDQSFYVLSVDVGRKGWDTVIMVLKVIPQVTGAHVKKIVNIVTMANEHFEDQAIEIKRLFTNYKAKRVVIDGNGLGIGLIDYMVKSQITSDGEYLPSFGIMNDEEEFYKEYIKDDTYLNAVYIVKANAAINSEAHVAVRSQLTAGKLKFLVSERVAQKQYLSTKAGRDAGAHVRAEYLRPYTLTSILREEMLNLLEEMRGNDVVLKQANKRMGKDMFSALEYGIYYIKIEEEKVTRKRNIDFSKMMMFGKGW